MTSVFCAISLIKNVPGGRNNSCSGIATYRVGEDEFQDFTFKAFYTNDNDNNVIAEIFKSSISLVIGRLSLENKELYVRKCRISFFRLCSLIRGSVLPTSKIFNHFQR